MILVLVLSVPFIFVLVRKPVLRRLALRNASRRPRETMLVLLGSLLGTAIITGSLIVGDTLGASIRRNAFTQLGPVDETVLSDQPAAADAAAQRITALKSVEIDGVLPVTGVTVAATSTGGPNRKAEPQASLWELDFARGLAFGGDSGATGLSGATPAPGNVAITEDLARTLAAKPGDNVEVFAYGKTLPLRVDRVLPRLGIAGLHMGFGSSSPNLFAAPGTAASLAAGGSTQAAPPQHLVLVSNRGGVIGDEKVAASVQRQVTDAVRGLPVQVKPSKQDLLDNADSTGKQFTQLFQGIGMFGVLAGILLLVNIFVMLAQERKTEMGMLRAVGLRRSGLVGSFSLEGWLYALGSAALGTIAGIGVGRVIVWVASGIFGQEGRLSLEIRYAANLASIQAGFAAGFLISLVTVVVTSLWVSRLNVIRAIRDLPEPDNPRTRLFSLVVGVVLVLMGGVLTASGVAAAAGAPTLIGPALVGLGAYLVLRRSVPRRPLVTAASAGVLAWEILAFSIVPRAFRDAEIFLFVIQGVVLTSSAVALVTVNQDAIGGFLRRIGGGSHNMSLRLGLAYPLARRFRTGMILTMYALVVFTLTFITVMSNLFAGQIEDFTRKVSGGFDLQVTSNPANPVPVDAVRSRPEVTAVAALSTTAGEFQNPRVGEDFVAWPATTFDPAFVDQGAPALTKRAPQFADDAAAYRAVLAPGSDQIVVSRFFMQRGGPGPPAGGPEIGDLVVVRDPLSGRTHDLHVAAVAESGFGNLLTLVPPAVMREVFGARAIPDTLYVATKPGLDPSALADSFNGEFVANGADAKSFEQIVADNLSRQEQFFHLMQGYLALGLVVGIAGLGVVMVRAVRERRRQVGVLRALGFEARAVRRAFVTESAFVALEGIFIGSTLALVTAWRLIGNADFGAQLGFSVPWLQLLVLVVGTFLASLVATAAPARQASRIRPAVALRIAD